MTRNRTKNATREVPTPRKKLVLARKTIRDLRTKDVARQIKGGRPGNSSI